MVEKEIIVDTSQIDELAKDITRAKRALIGRLGERGYQILREEVPYKTGNLKQGVAPPDVDYENLTATLTVSARSGRTGPQEGILVSFDKHGTRTEKPVSLRAQPAFNYAEAVARGRASIAPKHAKALLIPVTSVQAGEDFILAGGQMFILRKSAGPTKPNPFDERAAERLSKEAPSIGKKVLEQFV